MSYVENKGKNMPDRAVVVAQLAEWSLRIPEVCSSNPVIGDFLYKTFIYLLSTTYIVKVKCVA